MIEIEVRAKAICDDCGAVIAVPDDVPWVDCEAVEAGEAVVFAIEPHGWTYNFEDEETLCPKCVAKRGN